MMQGITLDQFYNMTNSTEEKLMEEYHDEAKKRVENRLIIDKIIEKEKIEATDEEIDARVEEIAKKYKLTKEEVKKQYDDNMDYIGYDIKARKVFDIIKG